jgi:integrase
MVYRTVREQSGSVFFDTTKGRWVAAKKLPPGIDGKRKRQQRTFRSKREAIQYLKHSAEESLKPRETLFVNDLLDGWWKSRQRRALHGELAVKTMSTSNYITQKLRASLGDCVADSLSVDEVEEFLSAQTLYVSLRYVQLMRNVLDQSYRWGARSRLLTWNPAALAILPHDTGSTRGEVLDAEQATRLLQHTAGGRWGALWATMLGAGLRPGEALALTWPCLDLDMSPGVLHVRHYLRTGADGPFLGEPKTARSSRSLDLPTFTTDALKDLQEISLSPSKGQWKGLVFCTDTGLPLDPANVRRALRKACKTAGVPLLTPYDLRRTAGSLLVDAGVHLEQVADLLGHSNVATTRRHYVRAMRPTISHAQHLEEVLFSP